MLLLPLLPLMRLLLLPVMLLKLVALPLLPAQRVLRLLSATAAALSQLCPGLLPAPLAPEQRCRHRMQQSSVQRRRHAHVGLQWRHLGE